MSDARVYQAVIAFVEEVVPPAASTNVYQASIAYVCRVIPVERQLTVNPAVKLASKSTVNFLPLFQRK